MHGHITTLREGSGLSLWPGTVLDAALRGSQRRLLHLRGAGAHVRGAAQLVQCAGCSFVGLPGHFGCSTTIHLDVGTGSMSPSWVGETALVRVPTVKQRCSPRQRWQLAAPIGSAAAGSVGIAGQHTAAVVAAAAASRLGCHPMATVVCSFLPQKHWRTRTGSGVVGTVPAVPAVAQEQPVVAAVFQAHPRT